MPVLEAYVNNVWSSLEVPVFREALEAVEADDLERLINADHVCYASKLAEESRDSSVKIGNNLLKMTGSSELGSKFRNYVDDHKSPGTYPAVLAVLSHELEIGSSGEVSLLYVNLMEIAAAMVRMGEIDYLAAQEAVQHVIDSVPTPPPFGEEYQSFPLADIESMRHEYSNNRMFMS